MTLLLTVLGAMLCSLMVSSQVQPQADFDLQKVEGTWYLWGVATNAPWMNNLRNNLTPVTAVMKPTSDMNLQMSYTFLNPDGSCRKKTNLGSKTDTPGRFMFIKGEWLVDYQIVVAKYDEYIMVSIKHSKEDIVDIITKIYGRVLDMSDDALEKFTAFSLERDILLENVIPTPTGTCPGV